MAHRLSEKYPSLYQLCRFDPSSLKEQLSQFTSEDISAINERALIDRMDGVYQSLTDESIMTARSPAGKLCNINKAAFISIPCGFDSYGGTLRLYMRRSPDAAKYGGIFRFDGFGTKVLPGVSSLYAYTSPQELNSAQIIKAKRIPPGQTLSEQSKQIEWLQHNVSENRMRASLVLHELETLRHNFSQPITETQKLSLFAQLKQRLRQILSR